MTAIPVTIDLFTASFSSLEQGILDLKFTSVSGFVSQAKESWICSQREEVHPVDENKIEPDNSIVVWNFREMVSYSKLFIQGDW